MAGVSGRRSVRPPVDGVEQHRDWLSLVEVDGPFLTLPVLTRVWPTLDALPSELRDRLRDVHMYAADKPQAGSSSWSPSCLAGTTR
jgi:hypothetical protein